MPNSDENVLYSLRQKPEPEKKGTGYKVFVLGKDGKLYPPMVANPNGAATPVGVWLDADAAPVAGESKTGRPQVKQGGKGTQGGSGKLAYRPGWHLGVIPYAIQFNRKDAEGNKTLFPKNFVFAEVEYAADKDYQDEAHAEGINSNGKYQHSLAGLKHLPTDGYYMYRTNPNPETDPWVITGAMKVNRLLTRAEQADIVRNAGREPQKIQEGDIVTDDVVNSINQEIAAAPKFSLKVYHGSGADFTEFDFDHMGEGAGSQSFGWGGYVTSSKKIGKSYANLVDANAPHQDVEYVGNNAHEYTDVVAGLFNGGQRDYDDVKEFLQNGYNTDKENARKKQMLEWFESTKPSDWKSVNDGKRNLYEVDIPDDNGSNYLEWEKKPSDEVATKIIEGIYGLDDKTLDDMAARDIVFRTLMYDYIKNADKKQMIPILVKTNGLTRNTVYDNGNVEDDMRFVYNRLSNWMGSPKAASKFLSSLGFTGIKYPAGTIYGGAEEGDVNYVIFKPEDMHIVEHEKFSVKSKPVRFEIGKKLSDEEKKEVLSTLKDAYKVNGVPYHIEETAGGKEKRVYEPTLDSYVVSDITNRPLRYYITLPDGRVAHPTEVYPNISDNEVKSSATKQGLLDDEADQIVSAAIGNMKGIADNAKAVEVLTELQNLPHETHDIGYGLNNAQSYNYKTGIFTSDAAQAIDYVVRRMRRKEDVPAEIPAALKKAVADSYGMVDNLIDGMSNTKVGATEIKPVGVGAFGNIYNQFRGKAKAAIEFLKKLGNGEAAAALHHHTIGDISLVWGDKKTGLDKILRKHPEVIDNLQSIIDSMEVVLESDNRIKLESPTHFAVVSKEYKGEPREQWLLTAYEKRESLENGKSMDTATSSLGGDTALSQSKESAANIANPSETSKQNAGKFSLRLQDAINETDTEPTEAQKKSGNYKKGHVKFGGYDYTIENPKGSYRSGVDENGKEWKQKMNDTYGYIRGKFGKDGDHLDMFINDKADLDSWNGDVFVVDQVNQDGTFDEHKVMYGYGSLDEAKKAYLSNYEKGWTGLGNITPVSKADFDKWLDKSNRKLKPFADYADITSKTNMDTAPSSFEEFLEHPAVRYSIRNEKERAAAEVPDNLGEDVRKGIENAGLPMYDYDPTKEGDRSRAFNEAINSSDNIRFSLKEEKEKIVSDAKANGTYMTAPNGEKTKLNAEQWVTVRTTNFKNWFGDWKNDPENASKVVDKNGEPMVVWHGRSAEFNTFEKKEGVRFIMGLEDKVKAEGFFFSPNKGLAEEFASNSSRHRGGKANVIPCFLNIRKPMDLTKEDYDRIYEDVTGWDYIVGMDTQDNLWGIMDEEGMADKIKGKGYDGVIFVEEVDDSYEPTKISYCALDANQIKSAENNNGDFSADNNDIRFSLKSMMEKPGGWKQANKKAIHIAEAIERDPKFSLKNLDGTLIKAGTYFSGGGLVEEGLKGIIDPVVAVEYDEKISGVYRNNFSNHIVTADVRDVDPKELVGKIDGEVEYFHASPVCKNYSLAKNNHEELELDKETAASTAEFISKVRPKVVTIENVKGYKDSEAMKTITDALDEAGYKWDADVYNAADYGGYTNRERLIVRAVRDGELPAKPEKQKRKSGWYEAVEDIIPTLTEKKNGVAPWMDERLKADGIDWRHIDKPLYVMGSGYANGTVPHAFADELLPTLRTKSGDVIVMPDGKVYRAMGRVLARVSGVSDDYQMPASEALSHTIIGNGIPTQLTENVIAPLVRDVLHPAVEEKASLKDADRKQTQLDIILKTNPMLDDYHTGIRKVEDIKTLGESVEEARSEAEKYGDDEWSAYPDITNDMLQNALETGEITIYSSKPIKNGVFVTPSYMQASDYAGGGNVYEKTVPLTDVAWINTDEGQYAKVDGERYSLKEVNDKFNDRLAQLIENPNQKDRVLHLGRSSQFLIDGGIADAEIELDFDKFVRKSSEKYKNNHPFSAGDIKDLPKAIAHPVAVFNSTTKKDHVVMTELNHDGKNFIVAIRATEQNRKNKVVLEVNQITSLYPKGERGIIYWINNNKLSNVDKEKALHFIEALQPHAGTLTSEELSSAANIVRNFVNPKQNDGNLQKTEKYSLRVDRYRDELNQWKKDNNLPKDAERPQLPVREPNDRLGFT
ncbi:DNA cytosine methyltransferase [Prevotella pectinovora]|uniref:ADP-ribosyltransferase-containing protein n=1 Tax=Prevotella pectinovora TaxID=1602169 RepID=UPI00307A4B9B